MASFLEVDAAAEIQVDFVSDSDHPKKNWGDSSTLGCMCWSRGYSTGESYYQDIQLVRIVLPSLQLINMHS